MLWQSIFWSDMKSWIGGAEQASASYPRRAWEGHGKVFTATTAHILPITCCLTGLSLLAHPLPGIYLCLEKRMGPSIFSFFSSSCGTGVASSCPCWSPGALMASSLLGASSEVMSHPTPPASPSTPLTAVSQAGPASVLCCCSQALALSSRYFISFCGWWLVMKSPCCSFLPQRRIF